jgi:hypothetical protein
MNNPKLPGCVDYYNQLVKKQQFSDPPIMDTKEQLLSDPLVILLSQTNRRTRKQPHQQPSWLFFAQVSPIAV